MQTTKKLLESNLVHPLRIKEFARMDENEVVALDRLWELKPAYWLGGLCSVLPEFAAERDRICKQICIKFFEELVKIHADDFKKHGGNHWALLMDQEALAIAQYPKTTKAQMDEYLHVLNKPYDNWHERWSQINRLFSGSPYAAWGLARECLRMGSSTKTLVEIMETIRKE